VRVYKGKETCSRNCLSSNRRIFAKRRKIKQKVLRHIGKARTMEELPALMAVADIALKDLRVGREGWLPGFCPELAKASVDDKVLIKNLREESRHICGIHDVFGKLYSDLGFGNLLGNNSAYEKALKECVLGRISRPSSKRKTVLNLSRLQGELIPLQKIYRMMDAVYSKEEKIKTAVMSTTLELFKQRVEVLFFDVTTLYFESFQEDELREFGFSKDCKFKETQVVLALISTTEGQPITYELFPGSTYEGNTLITMIDSLKKRFSVDKVVLVADRAMFNEKNLILMEENNIRYVVAAKLRSLNAELKNRILTSVLYQPASVEDELHWVGGFEYKEKRRLVVSYSSIRASHDAYKRGQLLERVTEREKDGTIRVKDLIKNRGTTKFLKVTGGVATIDHDKIAEDAKWDGIHGVVTNIVDQSDSQILSRYRGLWQIEEAFRLNKHDLRMRPIYHWTARRIRAHIAICFLAFTLAKRALVQLKRRGQKLSFEKLRDELLLVQASVLIDRNTKKRYRVPSLLTTEQRQIYSVFSLQYFEEPTALS
jgi:transposase